MKKYDDSLETFREALQLRHREAQLAKKSAFSQEAQLKMAKIKHNIGCVNFEIGDLELAKASYNEAIQQQKAAFGTWTTPFMILTDTTKPGFLTMASTMCNKGEQSRLLLV
jgi:tetratricopeptide (TPR) repeat protein